MQKYWSEALREVWGSAIIGSTESGKTIIERPPKMLTWIFQHITQVFIAAATTVTGTVGFLTGFLVAPFAGIVAAIVSWVLVMGVPTYILGRARVQQTAPLEPEKAHVFCLENN